MVENTISPHTADFCDSSVPVSPFLISAMNAASKQELCLFYFIQYTKCQHAKTVNKWERRPCCTSSIKLSRTTIHSDMLRDQYFHALKKKYTINVFFFYFKGS